MIFVVVATMVKQAELGLIVRASSLILLNATSEAEAKDKFISSADVTEHTRNGWTLGELNALHLPPETLLQDADFIGYLREKHAEALKEFVTATTE